MLLTGLWVYLLDFKIANSYNQMTQLCKNTSASDNKYSSTDNDK